MAKEEGSGEGKGNLGSISEEHEAGEVTRGGSVRQSKDSKAMSKIANLSGLGKKKESKEGKGVKNGYVADKSEKEKRLSSQNSKDSVKASRAVLLSEISESEANVNGSTMKKRGVDAADGSMDVDLLDSVNLEAMSISAQKDAEPVASSVQVSSV